jgi:hypothetical protein
VGEFLSPDFLIKFHVIATTVERMWLRRNLYDISRHHGYGLSNKRLNISRGSTMRLLRPSRSEMPKRFYSYKSYRFASTTAQSSSSSSQHTSSSTHSVLKLGLLLFSGSVVLFGAGCVYSVNNSKFGNLYTSYIPLASWVVERLEEREYESRIRAREAFYQQQQEVTPYVSRVHLGDYEHSYGQANSGVINEDPLAPEFFFNPSSGKAGTEIKEYLPLISIPETNEPLITHTALCVNDLISSVNASATSIATVSQVSNALYKLAAQLEKDYPEHASQFKLQAQQFEKLTELYGNKTEEETKRIYHQLLSRGVYDVERQLVFHVNKRGLPSSSSSSTGSTKPISPAEKLALIMEIQLALTMATSGVESNTPYIEGARRALKSHAVPVRKQLVAEALKGVNLPDSNIDLQAIVDKILE